MLQIYRKGFVFLLITGVLFIFNSKSFAVPAAPVIFEISQPDGTTFKAKQEGDEWLNWVETEDGYTIIQDETTGWWYYAIPDEVEGIRMSAHLVGKIKPKELNIKTGLRPKQKRFPKVPARGSK